MAEPHSHLDTWKHRRRLLWAVVAFCMAAVAYVLVRGLSGAVAETTVTMAFLCMGAALGSYVFGACWEDIRAKQAARS